MELAPPPVTCVAAAWSGDRLGDHPAPGKTRSPRTITGADNYDFGSMPYQFLSPEYCEAGTRLLSADADVRSAIDGVEVSLLYAVRDGPGGDFAYHIAVSGGEVELGRGEIENPSATVKSTYDTAAKIARRELSNQVAFLTGKVRISGNLGALMKHTSTLDLLQEKLGSLDTVY